jgi:hypothetical protein
MTAAMSGRHDCPRTPEEWRTAIAALVKDVGSAALSRRDQLAICDSAMATSLLSEFVADGRAVESSRINAAWLLKDLCDSSVAPNLDIAARAPDCPARLREQILDTLERISFATPGLTLDLNHLSEVVHGPGEKRHFFSLLVNIGSDQAQKLLGDSLARDEDRPDVLRVLDGPAAWIDSLLERARVRRDPDGTIAAAIEARRHRELHSELKRLPDGARVGADVIQRLWTNGDVSLIAWLATRRHLDDRAIAKVLKLEPADRLPKHQRQLLARAQESLSSWKSVPPLGIAFGSRLADTPRFNLGGRSLVVGPYHSAESREVHLAETYGSGDPFLDTTDEIRFSSRTSQLVSLNIGVPERPTRDSAFIESVEALPLRRDVPTLPPGEPFQTVVATHTWIDLDGQRLAVFRDGVRPTARLEIAADLEMALDQETISGFILRDPARYLTSGWTEAESTRPDVALGTVLATYIHLLDGQFVDRLDDGDAAARRAVEELLERTKQVNASPQRSVLLEALDGIIDTFFS